MRRLGHPSVPESEATPEHLVVGRRSCVLCALASSALLLPSAWAHAQATVAPSQTPRSEPVGAHELTPLELASGFNNYLEFSSDKKAIKTLAQALVTDPWSVEVDGEVEKPLRLEVASMAALFGTEERIYRFRCVEGWSMVVPWQGFALARLLERARPTSKAKYVVFESLKRSSEMIGQRTGRYEWPYIEGLRIDEAMHPLTFVATGMYGRPLPKQNGAPVRIVVPWKYGFKSPKAVVRIHLTQYQPQTFWTRIAPGEYGFYANVNPAISHPRWSQAREVRLGELKKRPTLPFNGYGDDVAALYQGVDPKNLY